MKRLIAALGLLILVLILGFGVVLYGIRNNWFGTDQSEKVTENTVTQETVEEVEPEESLEEETVSEEHDEFMDELVSMRSDNDEDKDYVPEVVVDTENGTITVGTEEQEDVVVESDGEQVLDVSALSEAIDGTNLTIPDTDEETITMDEFAEANGMDTTEDSDGNVVLSDTYQTARIVVSSDEPVTDENAVSVAGPFNGIYVLQYESSEEAEEACESFANDENVEYAEAEQLCFLAPPDSDDVESYQEAAADPESAEIAKESSTLEETLAETEESADTAAADTGDQLIAENDTDSENIQADGDNVSDSGNGQETESQETEATETESASGGSSQSQTSMFSYKTFETWGYDVVGFSHMKGLVKKVYGKYSAAPVIKVAVIDSGIDYNHPWFKNRLVSKGYDFVNNDKNATDDYMHGTVVSGVIAKYTSSNVKILPLKAGDSTGTLSDIDVYNAIEYAIKKKVDVINMSFGRIDSYDSDLLRQAVYDANDAGIVLVAAYGNDSKKTSHFLPARYKNVVGVSSVNMYKKLSSFSNYGTYVDMTAPGDSIYTAYPTYMSDGDPYAYMSGTSLSAPIVSAACAMVKTFYPKAKASKIKKILYNSAKQLGSETYYGHGLVYLKKFTYDVPETSAQETTAAETTAAQKAS